MNKIATKLFASIILITLSVSCVSTTGKDDSNSSKLVKVILVGGQSNAFGLGAVEDLPTNLQVPQKDVLFYEYEWAETPKLKGLQPRQADHPSGHGGFGPELTFGHTIADAHPGETFAIIKHTYGATSLFEDWHHKTGPHYRDFKNTISDGMAALSAAGYTPEIVGMLWHQGESDALEGQAAAYEDNLKDFIADVRVRYGSELLFLIGEVLLFQPNFETIITAQKSVAAADPLSVFVPASDLSTPPEDLIHFDAKGMMELGKRFATAYSKFISENPTHGLKVNQDLPFKQFWNSDIILGEQVLFQSFAGEAANSSLLFEPTEILRVTDSTRIIEYVEGVDYYLEGRNIILKPGSKLFSCNVFSDKGGPAYWPRIGGGTVYYNEGSWFHEHQYVVDYKHNGRAWLEAGNFEPQYYGDSLPHALGLLNASASINVTFLGDSITVGSQSSGFVGAAPYLPIWAEQVCRNLESFYGSKVQYNNISVGGTKSEWGITQVEALLETKPDLAILAFGMNDSATNSIAQYKANIDIMISKIRTNSPDTDILLVASMLPNKEVAPDLNIRRIYGFRDALYELAESSIFLDGFNVRDASNAWSYHGIDNTLQANSIFAGRSISTNPYIQYKDKMTNVHGSNYTGVEIRQSARKKGIDESQAAIHFQDAKGKWYKHHFTVKVDGVMARYTLDMTKNADWMNNEITQLKYLPVSEEACHFEIDHIKLNASKISQKIAVADLTSIWDGVLKLKRYADVTGNNVNHPNDMGMSMYSQTVSSALIPYKSSVLAHAEMNKDDSSSSEYSLPEAKGAE